MSRYVLSSGLGLIQSLMPVGEAAIASCSSTRVAACIVPPRECFMSFFQRSCASSAALNDRSSPAVNLSNLRDNSKATKKVGRMLGLQCMQLPEYGGTCVFVCSMPCMLPQRIRVGRGNSSRRGNYCGRGQNGHNARSTPVFALKLTNFRVLMRLLCLSHSGWWTASLVRRWPTRATQIPRHERTSAL